MHRTIALVVALLAGTGLAQDPQPNEQVIVVPPPQAEPEPTPQPEAQPQQQPPPTPTPDVPPAPETRTFEASPPPEPMAEPLDETPQQLAPPSGPGAMLDGHPREGAFLSGPGSAIFLTHHTLMLGLGGLATQMVPRLIDAAPPHHVPGQAAGTLNGGCDPAAPDGTRTYQVKAPYSKFKGDDVVQSCSDIATGPQARVAYLTSALLGAGIGFASASIWQFFNWMSVRSANFGILNSAWGSLFLGAIADLVTKHSDAWATSWLTLIGGVAGGWLSVILAKGDYPLNKMFLVTTGAAWAAIYAALVVGIVATTGGGITARDGIDAVMLMPAVGAAAFALAALKFNPSIGQVMRANLFGGLAGAIVLVVSGLLLGPTTGFTKSPVPYILSGVTSAGAMTLVSLLWVDAVADAPGNSNKKALVWW